MHKGNRKRNETNETFASLFWNNSLQNCPCSCLIHSFCSLKYSPLCTRKRSTWVFGIVCTLHRLCVFFCFRFLPMTTDDFCYCVLLRTRVFDVISSGEIAQVKNKKTSWKGMKNYGKRSVKWSRILQIVWNAKDTTVSNEFVPISLALCTFWSHYCLLRSFWCLFRSNSLLTYFISFLVDLMLELAFIFKHWDSILAQFDATTRCGVYQRPATLTII